MADVLVIFGSATDKETYEPILLELEKEKISYKFRILSAHKTPNELKEVVEQSDARLIIAGAGLSAALPGVIASHTTKPVIGVPCKGAFDGLDAFLSVLQMPPGVPVLTVGIGKGSAAIAEVKKILAGIKRVHLVQRSTAPLVKEPLEKCKKILKLFGVKFDIIEDYECGCTNCMCIGFVPLKELELVHKVPSTILIVPVAEKDNAKIALALIESRKQNFFVGLNNAENAAIAAVELLNLSGKYGDKLIEYREQKKKMVLGADSEEAKQNG